MDGNIYFIVPDECCAGKTTAVIAGGYAAAGAFSKKGADLDSRQGFEDLDDCVAAFWVRHNGRHTVQLRR